MNGRLNKIKSVLAQQAPFHLVALAVWLHVFIFLKWDSDILVPDDIVMNPWYESQNYKDKYDKLVRLNEEHEKAVVKMQSLQNRFNSVSKSIEKTLLEHNQHLLLREQNSTNVLHQHLFAHAPEGSFHSPDKLRLLLENVNLEDAYPLENSLRPAFREATADLQRNMELGMSDMDWRGLKLQLKSIAIPERPVVEVLPGSCDAIANRGTYDETNPTEDDMETRIQNLRDLAAKRWEVIQEHGDNAFRLPFSSESTIQRQHSKREEMLISLEGGRLQRAKELTTMTIDAELDERTMGQCIKSQNVLPWLEDGLQAYFQGRDPRQAILRKVLEEYPTIDSPEALIGMPSLFYESATARAAPTNLRQLLDGPFITESVRGINVIIDSMGGYSDWFDQYIDGLGVDDVGKVVIQTLMQNAGNVKLPPMPNVFDAYYKASTTH